MKKISIIVAFILICSLPINSRGADPGDIYIKTTVAPKTTKLKIAVIPENWDPYWVSSYSWRALITELMDAGFTVVERSNLEAVMKELYFQNTGMVSESKGSDESRNFNFQTLDRNDIKKLGEMLGVDALLMVYVIPSSEQLKSILLATFRMVDVQSGKVLTSTTVSVKEGIRVDIILKKVAIDIATSMKSGKRVISDDIKKDKDFGTMRIPLDEELERISSGRQ